MLDYDPNLDKNSNPTQLFRFDPADYGFPEIQFFEKRERGQKVCDSMKKYSFFLNSW